MTKVLKKEFFDRPALEVAKSLLGKFLVRRYRGKNISATITEVEAYVGPGDKASHAHRGLTPRNAPMFGEAGRFYVYFTYGMHWLLNVVTGKKGFPAAVLIRAVKTENDVSINGPARLTKYLKIDKRFNGKQTELRTGLWFEDRGVRVRKSQIKRGKRIGVEYAGKWAEKPYNLTTCDLVNFRD